MKRLPEQKLSSTIVGDISGNAATVTNGIYTSSSVTDLSDVSSVGSGAIITSAERTKLTNIEALADVTDAANVAAAGAVMNTRNETIAGTKTFSSTIVGDINGNAATVTNGIYTTSSVADLNDVSSVGSKGAIITSAERTKLTNIEALADVTDATNVAAAGAVMNTGDETIAGAKTFSSTIVGSVSSISNHNTDDLSEGSTNLYFTDARARAGVSGDSNTGVSVSNGVVSIGQNVGTSSNVQFNNVTVGGVLNSDDITAGSYCKWKCNC